MEPPRGLHETTLDDQGRLLLPDPFRQFMQSQGGSFWVTWSGDHLEVFTAAAVEKRRPNATAQHPDIPNVRGLK